MTDWVPAAALPNIELEKPIEGEGIALVPLSDPRVQNAHPKFRAFLERFTDAFKRQLKPTSLIVRDDLVPKIKDVEALRGFRDAVALSVVPYARSLNQIHAQRPRACYSDFFWFYPWMLDKNYNVLVASTPALDGLRMVDSFKGQSSPGLSVITLEELDTPLSEHLARCWHRHYIQKRRRWQDRALFRSLNMAYEAASMPASSNTTLYDIGRSFGLWVSAFEILAHPGRSGRSNIHKVYGLFEQAIYSSCKTAAQRFNAFNSKSRRSLPCSAYGRMYDLRNHFMHGNPIGARQINPRGDRPALFWIAPALYRLALTGFLKINPSTKEPVDFADFVKSRTQSVIEQAVLQYR